MSPGGWDTPSLIPPGRTCRSVCDTVGMPRITPRFRPLPDGWTDPKDSDTHNAPFKVDERVLWSDLSAEIVHLQDKQHPDEVVVQLDVDESDIRVDGTGLKAGAKLGYHGVVVSFESRHGPLRYAADHYRSWGHGRAPWRANIRAVTLTLGALRAIDRYGVAASGQQYSGWLQLGAGTAMPAAPAPMTIVEAMNALEQAGGRRDWFDPRIERLTKEACDEAYRAAAKRTHPDVAGGSTQAFQIVQAAYEVLIRNAR